MDVERAWAEGFEVGSDHAEHVAAEQRAKVARAAVVVYRHAQRVRALLDAVHDGAGWQIVVDELTGEVVFPEDWERKVETLRDEYEEVERAMDLLESCVVQDGADMLEEP